MALQWQTGRKLRILDFDCEARPLSWIAQDYVSKEITAIAAKFIGERGQPKVWLMGEDGRYSRRAAIDMLEGFRAMYDAADMVTGHYCRAFDQPLIAGAMIEYELAPLSSKLTHDTKLDLIKQSGLSMSQENISATFELDHPKVGMNTPKWRAANRLTREGVRFTKERVAGDVLQHIEMRQRLLELGYLSGPKMWHSGAVRSLEYQP